MRNLKLKYSQQFNTNIKNAKFLLLNPNVDDKANNERFVVTSDKLYSLRLRENQLPKVIIEVPNIVDAEYLALDNVICLATGGGEVLLVNLQTSSASEGTFCDVGIERMVWSPDQDVVVFVTREYNVVAMTYNFDVLTEHALKEVDAEAENKFVNVGWGKKETQFHGSEGKQAAKKKSNEELHVVIDQLPQNIEITWRADGAYFAISYVCLSQGRTFKIFDKEGTLQFKAEKQFGLLPCIAWRPSGNWLAVPQKLPNKSVMALFEKNGLRHREIVLTFDLETNPIKNVKWSSDSEVLSIETAKGFYIYTINNYHWYLKQVLASEQYHEVILFEWDQRIDEEKTCHIMLINGDYFTFKWHWVVDGHMPSGLVTVIDGQRLLLTNFSKAIIPPPMSNRELQLEGQFYISSVIVKAVKDMIYLCMYDSGHNLHFYVAETELPLLFKKICETPFTATSSESSMRLNCIQWFDYSEALSVIFNHTKENTTYLHRLTADEEDQPYCDYNVEGTIIALAKCETIKNQWIYQTLEDGALKTLTLGTSSIKGTQLHVQLNYIAEKLEVISRDNHTDFISVVLTTNRCLYVDKECLATDVTSFCQTGNYLLFTKLASLHFVRLADLRIIDERRLERGSKLVTAISELGRVVLQMPRGNLEVINPRVLSLELINDLLKPSNRYYRLAFDMLRKQRINLNIICDHNIKDFLDNLDVFLKEIQNPNWLNLFISDLQNEDFTKTMYASSYKENLQSYPGDFQIENKVSYVCKALLSHMEASSEKRYCLPILTAYVKMDQLEKALLLIWEEKRRHCFDESEETEEALRYLLYLVDVNELFNVALGTYDFGLVLFVAKKSQKDPKEFLAMLNEWKKYKNDNYCKFKIDEYLKRYEKAIQHLAKCGAEHFEEGLTFIKNKKLFIQALVLYKHDNEKHKTICLAYADYLRAQSKLEDASIMYERGGNLAQALQSAKHILNWQRVLLLARKLKEDMAVVAKSLINPLEEQGKFEEAYDISKAYGNNFKQSLEILVRGKIFLKAIFEAEMRDDSLLDTLIKMELLLHCNHLMASLLSDKELFLSYKERLLAVRVKRLKKVEMLYGEGANQTLMNDNDLLSDTSSLYSSRYTTSSQNTQNTGKTFRSSKNRRKHERKLLSLKPGNPFEDIALIDALYNLIVKCFNQQQSIRDTCKALIMLVDHDAEAIKLQKQFKQLLTVMQDSLDEIWIPEIRTTSEFLQGPNIDYTQLQNEQRYAMIDPLKRFKPQLSISDWEYEILKA
ncbi:putative elongator complex protein 1 [Glossina fuscipes]|uniref:Elongator complex protein 1 n=1 Tax=Glossina fuscipes TaxID=7396 RepID=A0A9C5ZFX3_9MUSC|nr:putative elongator complex protein 1 [Glossina fuscipes]